MENNEERSKILIVDDEKVNIDVLVGLLKPNYKIAAAKSGEQALIRLEKPPLPDLILLDIMMPDMDGYQVCRIIKETPATRGIPVIFITGKNDEQDEARGFQAGAVDYIVKPFSPPVALARVKTHIELKRRGDMLEQLAGLDGLTGIPNRRQFDRSLSSEWVRSVRHGHAISLILIDIDYFKFFNDHYGHTEGDDCLKKVANAIFKDMVRAEDLAARYGGEEFACILPQTEKQGALIVANRILDSVRNLNIPHAHSAAADHVTVSIGVATTFPGSEGRALNLVEAADRVLYQAKRQGRDRIVSIGQPAHPEE